MALRELYPELPSTQDRAVELARAGAEEGTRVVARRQNLGRGRGERRWASPEGGLYVSIVLRPTTAAELLPLAIGAGLADAFSLEYGVRLRLKWPNDLLSIGVDGTPRKLAGVLVDAVPTPGGQATAVAGIGVNAARHEAELPSELRGRAASLEELTRRPIDLERLEAVASGAALGARRALSVDGGERAVLARVRGLLYGAGEPVRVDGSPVGTLLGVRDDGGLAIAGRDGPTALYAGDVHVGLGP